MSQPALVASKQFFFGYVQVKRQNLMSHSYYGSEANSPLENKSIKPKANQLATN